MKITFLIAWLLFLGAAISKDTARITSSQVSVTVEKTYCDGWEDGYCEGWRDVKGEFAVCPVTPVCPVPEVAKTRYQDGYNRAFKAGSKKAKGE